MALAGGLVGSGCGGDECADLEEICALCPVTGNGIAAKDSCERIVAAGNDDDCADRLDKDTYQAFGCGSLDD
jgi:hypothetical protein